MNKKRKENKMISAAKGIGILLVLIGNFGFIPEVKRFIYLFHMPLFFFLSGYFFKTRRFDELPKYVVSKLKSLYIPFVLCNFFALIFHNLFCQIGIYSMDDRFSNVSQIVKYSIKILLCMKMEDIVAPLWFLPILMFVCIGYNCITLLIKNEKVVTLCVGAFFLLAYILIYLGKIGGPFRAEILVGTGMWVFRLGHIYSEKESLIKKYTQSPIGILCCIWGLVLLSLFTDVNMIQMRFSNPVFFTMGALFGINVTLWCASKLQDVDILRYCGNNSLDILEWHYWAAIPISLLQCHIYDIEVIGIVVLSKSKLVWSIAYLVVGIIVPLLIMQIKKILRTFRKMSDSEKIRVHSRDIQ